MEREVMWRQVDDATCNKMVTARWCS